MPHSAVLTQSLSALVEPLERDGFFGEDLLSVVRQQLKSFVEMSLELERTAFLGRPRHARAASEVAGDGAPRGARNGY